jgi:hypothetical protein
MAEGDRDLIGDQMGYAVSEMLSPNKSLRELDRKIMRSLPRPLARAIVLFRYEHHLLPEPQFNPQEAYEEFLSRMGKAYLDQCGNKHPSINTIVFDETHPIKAHKENWKDGDQEVVFHWQKQFEWAKKVKLRPEGRLSHELSEAEALLMHQREISSFYEKFLKPAFTKRGLPYPITPNLDSGILAKE